jgi:hypothetical protein
MDSRLTDLSLDQIKSEIKDIFIWPNSLDELNTYHDKVFKLASFSEVFLFNTLKFDNEYLDSLEKDLSLTEKIKLFCLNSGYAGLVNAKRLSEEYPDLAGTIEIGFHFKNLDDVDNRLNRCSIPLYFTNFRVGYKGLPVVGNNNESGFLEKEMKSI